MNGLGVEHPLANFTHFLQRYALSNAQSNVFYPLRLTDLGLRTKIIRPLDFLMVADHAENLGLAPIIEESNPELLRSEWGKKIHDLSKAGKAAEAFGMWGETRSSGVDALPDPELVGSMWGRMMDFPVSIMTPVRLPLSWATNGHQCQIPTTYTG